MNRSVDNKYTISKRYEHIYNKRNRYIDNNKNTRSKRYEHIYNKQIYINYIYKEQIYLFTSIMNRSIVKGMNKKQIYNKRYELRTDL